jgi:hypothetical protein
MGATTITTAAWGRDVGWHTSSALDSRGNLVVSYYDVIGASPKVLHCNDPDCGTDEQIGSSDRTGATDDVGQRGSLPPDPPLRDSAPEGEPFLQPNPVVVLADRLVCSLLGSYKAAAGIVGQDGSDTVAVDGMVYWTFGDTVLAGGRMLPNSIGWSADPDASDCITLVPKEVAGRPASLLPREPGELTVWPIGMEATAADRIHFYYASVVGDPDLPWRVAGVGLGSFDTDTLTAERALGGALIWTEGMPLPARTFADESHVYIFHNISRVPWTTDTILARVPKESIESPASYEYWDPGEPGEPGQWTGRLWDEETGSWDGAVADLLPLWRQVGMHNGVDVAYNDYLGRWLAVYSAGFLTSVNVRAADELTGPWDSTETVLVDCRTFHSPPQSGYLCYTGAQHEFYTRDGGRTIYVSYSTSGDYQVYLHEIRLAAPVTQWRDEQGRAIYLAGDVRGPDRFKPDGLTFYASDIPVPGLAPIHRWEHMESGAIRYGAAPPDPQDAYRDLGVDFYAPASAAEVQDLNALYAPVYLWTGDEEARYSPLDLGPGGYERGEVAFYAACPDADHDTLTDCAESFLGTDPASDDSDGDGLADGAEDFDGDGCTNAQELGLDHRRGGQRDPLHFWDFFDTPDASNVRNRRIGLFDDIMGVAARFGAAGDPSGDPLAGPIPPAPAYHTAFDRGAQVGPNPWDLGPPDGVISIPDILRVGFQFGHNCS